LGAPGNDELGDWVKGDGVVKDGTVNDAGGTPTVSADGVPTGASGDAGALPRGAVVLAPDVPVGAGTLEVVAVPGAAAVDVGGAADVLAAADVPGVEPRLLPATPPATPVGGWACVEDIAPTCARATPPEPALRQTTATNTRALCPTNRMWILGAHRKRHPHQAGHRKQSSSRFWPPCGLAASTSASIDAGPIGSPARDRWSARAHDWGCPAMAIARHRQQQVDGVDLSVAVRRAAGGGGGSGVRSGGLRG
jgi:hypothetical protein